VQIKGNSLEKKFLKTVSGHFREAFVLATARGGNLLFQFVIASRRCESAKKLAFLRIQQW